MHLRSLKGLNPMRGNTCLAGTPHFNLKSKSVDLNEYKKNLFIPLNREVLKTEQTKLQ
jgi:hypothetical protein